MQGAVSVPRRGEERHLAKLLRCLRFRWKLRPVEGNPFHSKAHCQPVAEEIKRCMYSGRDKRQAVVYFIGQKVKSRSGCYGPQQMAAEKHRGSGERGYPFVTVEEKNEPWPLCGIYRGSRRVC